MPDPRWLGPLVVTDGSPERGPDDDETPDATRDILIVSSRFSEPITFNTLHVPSLDVTGEYNYYTEHETNDEYNERSEQQYPSDAPMFTQISWTPVKFLELSDTLSGGVMTHHGVPVDGVGGLSLDEIDVINDLIDPSATVIIRRL